MSPTPDSHQSAAGPSHPGAPLSALLDLATVPRVTPPPNPLGGQVLVVDAADPRAYAVPSAALADAGPTDLIFLQPGLYEDKVFVAARPIQLVGAGRDLVYVVGRRAGPLYLQGVPSGRIEGITFRYVGSDQHSAVNVLDSTCTIARCRAMEAVLSGVLLYGPECRACLIETEVCGNRESGIFVFGGASPRVADNLTWGNHHFGLAVRDAGGQAEFVRNESRDNWLSGMLLFGEAQAMLLENRLVSNRQWGLVMTPECRTIPAGDELLQANRVGDNPRGALHVTEHPLADIGR
ncbi:MAG: right-handed parallel beta-helix repeat-containing protein [Nitrospiraceae bacterium]